jgi:hypothetical protein
MFKKSAVFDTFLKEGDGASFRTFKKLRVKQPVKLEEFYSLDGDI